MNIAYINNPTNKQRKEFKKILNQSNLEFEFFFDKDDEKYPMLFFVLNLVSDYKVKNFYYVDGNLPKIHYPYFEYIEECVRYNKGKFYVANLKRISNL
jgi:hypothetical protein